MSEVILAHDANYWHMEEDWLYECVPDCLGFDVTIKLRYRVKSYVRDEIDTWHTPNNAIQSVWMSVANDKSIDILPALPRSFVREILESFNDSLPEVEGEPDWDTLPGGKDYD
jgi:hypothetical protein